MPVLTPEIDGCRIHLEQATRDPEQLSKLSERKRELKDALEKLLSRYSTSDKG